MDEQTEAIRELVGQFLEFCSNTEPYLLPNLYTSPEDRASLIDGFLASQPPQPPLLEAPYVINMTLKRSDELGIDTAELEAGLRAALARAEQRAVVSGGLNRRMSRPSVEDGRRL